MSELKGHRIYSIGYTTNGIRYVVKGFSGWVDENLTEGSVQLADHGCIHRVDGPAVSWYDRGKNIENIVSESYYINGNSMSRENWENQPEVLEYLKQKAFDEVLIEILEEK